MTAALLQDWVSIEGTAATSPVVQSAARWLNLEGYTDAIFWLEVRGLSVSGTELYMSYETAPVGDPSLFTPMVPEFLMASSVSPVITKVLLSQNPSMPVAGLVRWRIRQGGAGAFRIMFRIHCLGKRKG